MGILQRAAGIGFVSMLTAVTTGAYMMAAVWGAVPWLSVTVGSLGLLIGLAAALTRPRLRAIGQALATGQGPASPAYHSLVNHPLLWVSIQARVAVTLGIILLKIAKPDLATSLLVIGLAVVVGLASALRIPRGAPIRAGSLD
jgi:hypothetical protein